jgi:hypothetical protein
MGSSRQRNLTQYKDTGENKSHWEVALFDRRNKSTELLKLILKCGDMTTQDMNFSEKQNYL